MKAFQVSTRYTAAELKQLDRTAKAVRLSRAELIHARSLGKIVTTHELADWVDVTKISPPENFRSVQASEVSARRSAMK